MTEIAENAARIREKIADAALRSGRSPDDVEIVGVTKTVDADRVKAAVRAGIRILGANYVQESLETMKGLSGREAPPEGSRGVSWHFIGRLQSNKAKYAVLHFDLIHSVDNEKLALEIHRQAARNKRVQPVLIQVNTGGEASKAGIAPEDAPGFAARLGKLENLSVQGLMTMPPFFDQPERVRPFFRVLNDLKMRIEDSGMPSGIAMDVLSMGMTGDFEVAVEEGATLVRIGTALFGERK